MYTSHWHKLAKACHILCLDIHVLISATIDVVFNHFMDVWKALIRFDMAESTVTISETVPFDSSLKDQGSQTSISDAAAILASYKLLDELAVQVWENIDRVILKPRTDIRSGSLRTMEIHKVDMVKYSVK
jgi:hypothetical protein